MLGLALIGSGALERPTLVNWLLVGLAMVPFGLAQRLVLRHYVANMRGWSWPVVTAVGGMLAGFTALVVSNLLGPNPPASLELIAASFQQAPYPHSWSPFEPVVTDFSPASWAIFGVCLGLAQSLLLGRFTKGRAWLFWVPANLAAWALGGYIAQFYLSSSSWDAVGGFAYAALSGLAVSGITGLPLLLLPDVSTDNQS